jgi:hypothetical protein
VTIINFTVQYDQFASQSDGTDEGVDSDLVALIGSVTFTPVFTDERPVMAPDYSPRPTGFKLLPIIGYMDSDGRLKSRPGGDVGVRLPANDPLFELDVLTYRVDFNLRTPLGKPVTVNGGFIAAPLNDQVVNLADVLYSTSSIGGPRIVSGEFADGTVVFENEDGSFVEAIEIPEGTSVWADNGDGTWSVG